MGPDRTTAPLSISLFGTFEVRLGNVPLPRLRTRKGQWLLALLTLRSPASGYPAEVGRAWLAGTLWPDSPVSLALASLRMSLKDLRRALGPEGGRLRSSTLHSLCLDLVGAAVDVVAFDAAIARGDPSALEEAVALYCRPLLEEWCEEWVFQERQAREQAYLRALETLAAGALAGGDLARAEEHLRRAAAADPLREGAQRGLMQALAAGGNYAAALEVYRELRLRLHREVNAEPDPETAALFQQIRAEARERAGGSRRASAVSTRKVVRPSVSLAARASAVGRRPSEPPPVGSREAFAHNLPVPLTCFIGREQAMAEVKRLLTMTRLLTLTGAGGCGKTRLALQVAADLLDGEKDGTWFVDLAPLTDPALVPQAIASVLGICEEPGRPLTLTLIDALLPKQLLLVLDNCEHLVAACAALAEAILRRCTGMQILATSRERMNIAGETTYRVPSLSSPDPRRLPPAPEHLTQYEAVRLFLERATAAVPAFCMTEENALAVAEICHRLDGIPLAIELAAARVRVLSAEEIAARLDDRFRLLTGGSRTALPRHQTLQALIGWSYDLLSAPERELLQRLTVFAGGWTLVSAEAVCAGDQIEEGEVLDLLTALVDKSLAVEKPGAETRYRLLETVRQYARDRLLEAGEAAAVQERHLDWCLALAERAEPELFWGEQKAWLDRLEREHDNLRAALAWCMKAVDSEQWAVGSPAGSGPNLCLPLTELSTAHCPLPTAAETGLRLGGAQWAFWGMRGYLREGREHLARVLALPGAETHTLARAKALRGAGLLALFQGDIGAARAPLEESLAISQELGDRQAIATSLNYLGITTRDEGDYAAARALHEESLAIFRELGDKEGIAWSLLYMGWATRNQGEYAAAQAPLEESLAIFRERGYKQGIAYVLLNLAEVAQAQGDYAAMQALYGETLAIFRELGEKLSAAWALKNLGIATRRRGDCAAARALLEEGLVHFRELGNKQDIACSLQELGMAAHAQEDYAASRTLWEEGLAIWRQLGRKDSISSLLQHLGLTAHAQGDYGAARAFHEESLRLLRELGEMGQVAKNLEGLAAVAVARGQAPRAARLFGAAEAIREASGAPLPPAERAAYERDVTTLRAALGEAGESEAGGPGPAGYAPAWAQGRAMTLPQAIAYALEESPPA